MLNIKRIIYITTAAMVDSPPQRQSLSKSNLILPSVKKILRILRFAVILSEINLKKDLFFIRGRILCRLERSFSRCRLIICGRDEGGWNY